MDFSYRQLGAASSTRSLAVRIYPGIKNAGKAVRHESDHSRLRIEPHAEAIGHSRLHVLGEFEDLRTGRAAMIDEHEGVLLGDRGIAATQSLQSSRFDEPCGR
jgi:hypothetical protein